MEKACLVEIAAVLVLCLNIQALQSQECSSYTFLNESNRAMTYNISRLFPCDTTLSSGWYRFEGKAGNQMAESCVEKQRCGTHAPGWLRGKHPAVADGAVQRQVCFHWGSSCCQWSTNITVRNCGGFYVYKLTPTPACQSRYCGNGVKSLPASTNKPTTKPSISGECSSYKFLNESNRAKMYKTPRPRDQWLCDDTLSGWYRFSGGAGNQIPKSCVAMYHCGTAMPGWLNGSHPAVADGAVQRTVCFNAANNCCYHSTDITVRNCGGFYVYNLMQPPTCHLRYCGNGVAHVVQAPSNKPTIKPSPSGEIQSVKLNASRTIVKVGSRIEISCAVIGKPINLNITWFNASKLIGRSRRMKIQTRGHRSRLTIRNVMAQDEGKYQCQSSTAKQSISTSIAIWVLPVLDIQPRVVTKRVGGQATFKCIVTSGRSKNANVSFVEVTKIAVKVKAKLPYNNMRFTVTNLQIPGGKMNYVRKFVCEMTYQQVLIRSEEAELTVVSPGVSQCPRETFEGVTWSATAGGRTDIKPCPNKAHGTATRMCSEKGAWTNANFTGCSSPEFIKLADAMDAITGGFLSSINAQQVLSQLSNASQSIKGDSGRPEQIYGGDLVIAVDILVKMAEYNSHQGSVSSKEDFENFAQVASNLLETTNRKTWTELDKAGKGRSQILVKAMDGYGLGVAATFNDSTKSRVVQTKNLMMRIDRVDQDSPLTSLNITYNRSAIYLPSQAFSSSPDSRVVTLIYLTLSDVLSLARDDEDKAVLPDTTIVSSTVYPRPPDILNKPVKIVLQNKKMRNVSDVIPQGKCVFWRPEETVMWNTSGCWLVSAESDVATTTCECDHLTIFAALMDPYGSTASEDQTKALEIISIVGCSISLFAVLITMAVTLFFWRVIKSPRAKVLLNLCAAIAVSNALAIFEGLAREKEGCLVVAACLQYFLLSLFSWMLCEGVLLYILLVQVLGGGAGDKVKYFYIFGWGFPAIVVAISLAVTQANGYGSTEACWLDVKSGLIWAFLAPALLVILVNTVVFILVMRQMIGTKYMQDKTRIEKIKAGVKASAVLLPMLGITWLFRLLSFSSDTIAFKYIFAIFNSLQGLVIFIFHCAFNKQIRDAIKRRRERSSTEYAAPATPKSKTSSIMRACYVVNHPAAVPKKHPNRAQNDYEMIDSVASNKNTNNLSPVDSTEKQPTKPTTRFSETPEEKDDNIFPVDDVLVDLPDSDGFEDSYKQDHLGRKISWKTFKPIPNETEESGANNEGSVKELREGTELADTANGVSNHVYDKTTEEYDPPYEENNTEGTTTRSTNETRVQETQVESLSQEAFLEDSRRSAEDVVDGMSNRIYDKIPREFDFHYEEDCTERKVALSTFKPFAKETEIKGPTRGRSLHGNQEDIELVDSGEGMSNRIYDERLEEYDPPFKQLIQRRKGVSLTPSSPHNQECLEETPLKEVLSLSSSERITKKAKEAKRLEKGQVNDDVQNDEDFEIKMKERRLKIDKLQAAADVFKTQKTAIRPTQKAWQKIRQKLNRSSFKVSQRAVATDKTTDNQDDDIETVTSL